MQLKLNRVGGNIEAHIDLSLSERRVAQQVAPGHVFADKTLADLELGIVIGAMQEEALRSACVILKQKIDAHPSMRSTEVVNFDSSQPQQRHETPCEEQVNLGFIQITMMQFIAWSMLLLLLAFVAHLIVNH